MDLLLERDRKIAAVECKTKEKSGRKDLHGIERLRKFYGEDEVPKAYVACPTDVSFDLDHRFLTIDIGTSPPKSRRWK